jgi:hypothetical protein
MSKNYICPECNGTKFICTFHLGPVNDVIEEGCECEYSDEAKSYNLHKIDKCECEEPCPTCLDNEDAAYQIHLVNEDR